jgi:metallo-beta-lactamase family protein
MRLTFLGATGTVTGSKYLLQHGSATLLVDCGLFQGYKDLRLRNWAALPLAPSAIDAVVLTHAHLDHSGYVPLLVRNGFRGKVYCSQATFDLCRIMLLDSGHLQEEEAEYLNRHKLSKHEPALPLYTRDDAARSLKQFQPVDFDTPWQAAAGLQATLSPSGHMLGSSFVRIAGGAKSIVFSGDIGRPVDPLLQAPAQVRDADWLVVESTYGDRLHEHADVQKQLADAINRTAARGGVVVIPAFAVGRAQTLLFYIHQLKASRAIHDLPVYLNSPMAASATEVYLRHLAQLRIGRDEFEAAMRGVHVVETPEESQRLNAQRGPMIIVAASGMATGGRVVHHLRAFAPHARNTILFAGFQAGGTRGATIAGGASSVRIFGEDVPIRAEVAMLDTLSAHADGAEIVQWMRGFSKPPQRTFITHGEPAAADAMRLRIERELHWPCEVPYYTQSVDLA